MIMLKLVTVPNNILTSITKPVTVFDEDLQKLIIQMEETLIAQTDPPGVGLAAPQIGRDLAIFIMKPTPKVETEIFINPRVLKFEIRNSKFETNSNIQNKKSKNKKTPLEGCLSVPRIWGPIKRNKKILIEYQTIDGEKKTNWFKGFRAVIIQHEMDHLNGILFTQRALEQNSQLFEETNGELEKIEYC